MGDLIHADFRGKTWISEKRLAEEIAAGVVFPTVFGFDIPPADTAPSEYTAPDKDSA